MISIEDFKKCEIKIGTILSAEKIPETERLVKLSVDLGSEIRQIISGIALHFPDPIILVGKQVPVLVNLESRIIKGYESNGMILYAVGENILTTLSPSEVIPNGTEVR